MAILRRIPGLRSSQISMRVVATIFYAVIVLAVTASVQEGRAVLGIMYAIFLLYPVFVFSGRKSIPLLSSKRSWVKVVGWSIALAPWIGYAEVVNLAAHGR